jgi:hypothetical protein
MIQTSWASPKYTINPYFYFLSEAEMAYALASAGASALSALGASDAASAAGASAAGSDSEEVQRVWVWLDNEILLDVPLHLPGCPSGAA